MMMATLSFYDEIQIIECPYTFCSLKDTIKILFVLNDDQIDNCLISYEDRRNKVHFILNESQYDKIIPIIESIVLKIELVSENTYLASIPILLKEKKSVPKLKLREKGVIEIKKKSEDKGKNKDKVKKEKKAPKQKIVKVKRKIFKTLRKKKTKKPNTTKN